MRRFLLLLLAAALIISGCSASSEGMSDDNENLVPYLSFEVDYNNVKAFCGDEKGGLYVISGMFGEPLYMTYYDENGAEISENKLEYNNASDMLFYDNRLYIAYSGYKADYGTGAFVDTYDIETAATESCCYFQDLSSIKSVAFIDGKIAAIGTDKAKTGLKCGYLWNGTEEVTYQGTAIYTQEGEVIETPFPMEMCGAENCLIIYGCDNENGYYFRTYENNRLSEPVYTNQLGRIKGLAGFGENCFVTQSANRANYETLLAGNTEEGSAAEIFTNVFITGEYSEIKTNGNFCWFINNVSGKIERIYLPAYYKGNQTIRMLCSYHSDGTPFTCGYNIETEKYGNEELALKILAQDSDYDICYVNSRAGAAGNIRDKGSFYPLNEVNGVEEYLDKLFPYLREACITENGEIWCIPVNIDGQVHFYNEENIKKTGFDLHNMTIEEYFDYIDYMKSEGYSEKVCRNSWTFSEMALLKYLAENNSFDTQHFRDTAQLIKRRFNCMNSDGTVNTSEFMYSSLNLQQEFLTGDVSGIYSEMDMLRISGRFYYLWNEDMRAAPVPDYYTSGKNLVNVIFIAVNPSTDNLAVSLDYISALTEYLSGQTDTFMLSDKTMYSDTTCAADLYDIFANGVIGYAYPDELYRTDFTRFLSGEITIDEFIAEADRKLSAYRSE